MFDLPEQMCNFLAELYYSGQSLGASMELIVLLFLCYYHFLVYYLLIHKL